jgi:hypothetical protein
MIKKHKRTLALLAILATNTYAAVVTAGTVTNATITSVVPTIYGGIGGAHPFFIYLSIADTAVADGCNSQNLTAFALDSNDAGGRAMIAVVLAAQATGRTITVVGQGSCNIWSVVETANVIYLSS